MVDRVNPERSITKTGLVLSGGGMRGAYEVGIVAGIAEVLELSDEPGPLFDVFSGTSVGAINATYFAANADRADHRVQRLADVWQSLRLDDHARVRPLGLTRWPTSLRARLRAFSEGQPAGTSLLDTSALELLVRRTIDWKKLHQNVDSGVISALLIAALHVVSGRTTMFTERAPGVHIEPTRDERRTTAFERITSDHVLASAAIPLLFPTRRVGEHYYCDGGLRFNTPIAPAIRAGAERIVVVCVRHERTAREMAAVEAEDLGEGRDLGPFFLAGKLLNALLLDPVQYDLQVLERMNHVMEVLEETLIPEELERIQKVWIKHRGAAYRRIKTLVFTPSLDLGRIAADYIRTSLRKSELTTIARYFIERAAKDDPAEADWASYLLFDGGFAYELIEIGRADALAQADNVRRFFAED